MSASLQIVLVGNTPQLTALWELFNADPLMSAYLYTCIIGHLLSAVLLGIVLGRVRLSNVAFISSQLKLPMATFTKVTS